MNTRQLEYILAIDNEKSISGAAQKLFISQSSLSQLLMHVEKELNTKLFQRNTTPLALTYAGKQYIKAARQILDIQRNLNYELEDINNSRKGKITIGIAPSRSCSLMPHVIPAFFRQYPDVEIAFVEEPQEKLDELLLQGKIDISFTAKKHNNKLIEYDNIYDEHILLALPQNHSLCDRIPGDSFLDLRLLEDFPYILIKEGHDIRHISNNIFEHFDIQPNILLESHSLDLCLHMTASGLGATFIPSSLQKIHARKDSVKCFKIGNGFYRKIAVTYRKNMYLPFLLREFITIAKKEIISNIVNE